MDEVEWRKSTRPRALLQYLQDRVGERKRRLFLAAFCRHLWHLIPDPRTRAAVEASERYADGLIGVVELDYARAVAGPPKDRSYTSHWLTWVGGDPGTAYERALAAQAAWEASRGYIYAGEMFRHSVGSEREWQEVNLAHCRLIREVFGNPFRPPALHRSWLTWNGGVVPALARSIYEQAAFGDLPILADALEEAGCADRDILRHCRQEGWHTRGCWVLDFLRDKK